MTGPLHSLLLMENMSSVRFRGGNAELAHGLFLGDGLPGAVLLEGGGLCLDSATFWINVILPCGREKSCDLFMPKAAAGARGLSPRCWGGVAVGVVWFVGGWGRRL